MKTQLFFGRRSACLFLIGALTIMSVAWVPAAATGGDGPKLSRAEQSIIHKAQQAMAAKAYAEAQEQLSDYIEQNDGKVHYLVEFSMGNAWMLDGQPGRALAHYQAAVNRFGEDAAIWQNLGKAYYELNRFSEAADSLAKACTLTAPPQPALAYQAAVAYLQAQRPADARPLLEGIVGQAGDSPEPAWLEALLKVYLDLGQAEKALALTRTLVREKGQDPRMWQVLTHLYINAKAYDKAAAALEIKAALAEASPEEIEQLGDLYRMAGVPIKAARQYEKILAHSVRPKDVEKVASAYLAARRSDAAIGVLKRGVGRQPTARLWWMLAGVYYEQEDFEQAMAAFEQCTRSDPDHARAYLMTGYCALQLERLPAAQAAFTQAARFPSQHAEARQRLKELGRYRQSISLNKSIP
jgi:tetratricopeptide (TPR) repeat protein